MIIVSLNNLMISKHSTRRNVEFLPGFVSIRNVCLKAVPAPIGCSTGRTHVVDPLVNVLNKDDENALNISVNLFL